MTSTGHRIVLGVSGSIAAVKSPEIVRLLRDQGHHVRCVMTKSAEQFVSKLILSTFSEEPALSDMFGPEAYQMPHIKWADEAELYLVAPASASTLAHFAGGIADDMVSLMYISTKAPVLIAPAMHNTMWEHMATQANVKQLKARGHKFVGPYLGPLADKTEGEGRLAEPQEIAKAVEDFFPRR